MAHTESGVVPEKMSALVLEAPGKLHLRRVPVPEPGPGELLLRVKAATTCGTDLKAYLRGHQMIPMPGLLGHEYAGDVAIAGPGAPYHMGDSVMGVHSAPCLSCFWCKHGQENLCESIMATKVLGAYSEYLLVPARIARLNVFRKPPSLPYEIASLLEPLACVAQGISMLPLHGDTRALVIGPGAIGLMFVAALRTQGVTEITLAGRNPNRLSIGERFGARTVPVAEIPTGGLQGFDVAIECTGQVEIWEKSVAYVRRGGTVMLFGGCPAGSRVGFDTARLHYDQITLLSPFHFGTNAVQVARDWLSNPVVDYSLLISGERALDEGARVFEDLRAGKGVKYVFKP